MNKDPLELGKNIARMKKKGKIPWAALTVLASLNPPVPKIGLYPMHEPARSLCDKNNLIVKNGFKKAWIGKFTILFFLAVIFQFTEIGSAVIGRIGDPRIAGIFKATFAYASGNEVIFITNTSTFAWTVPNDWTNASNSVEAVGAGATGAHGSGNSASGGGGGGGAYAESSNMVLSSGGTINLSVGSGSATDAVGGTDTWFNGLVSGTKCTNASATVCANGGHPSPSATSATGGVGGTVASSTGSIKYAGGSGANASSSSAKGGGGGGAAGPNGAGKSTTGGNGGNGDNGLGGAGGVVGPNNGGDGTEWISNPGGTTIGSGGGGGGANTVTGSGGNGGQDGGGGGGGSRNSAGRGGQGRAGHIIIIYTPVAPAVAPGTPTYASVATSTLTVNWTLAASSTQYDLTRSTDGNNFTHLATTTVLTYGDSGLSQGAQYWYRVRGADSMGDVGPWSASSSATTAATIAVTSIANNTESISNGGKSGDSITLMGMAFGTVSAGSRANCSGGAGTGCIQFLGTSGNSTTTVSDGDITAWTNTSITFNVSTTLATLGGPAALQVCGAGMCDATPPDFYVYPHVISMATCANCNANAGREYNASDTDGLIMLSGDHFGSATGTVLFSGNFNNASATMHDTAVGSCTNSGWIGSATSSNTACVEVPQSIGNKTYTGSVNLIRTVDSSGTVNAWANATALPTPRGQHGLVVNNGYMYAVGGASGGVTSSVLYAPINATGSLGAWVTTTALTSPITAQANVVNNGYIYSIGGSIDGSAGGTTSTVIYTSSTMSGTLNPWQMTTAILDKRTFPISVVNNGYVYVIAGFDGSNAVTSSVLYAPINATGSLGSWSYTAALPAARGDHGAVVYNGYIYVAGGKSSLNIATSTVYYAPINATGSLGAWSTTTPMPPGGRASHGLVVNNGYIYAIGGFDVNGVTSSVAYAPIDNMGSLGAWSTTTILPAAGRNIVSSLANNGYIYLVGGYDSASAVTSSAIYTSINSNFDSIGFTVLPRILSDNPVSSTAGTVVDVLGDHFCEDTANGCPTSTSSMSTAFDNVSWGSVTSTATDFQNLTGGAGACNGTGNAWTDSEICVKVPALAVAGSASTTITTNTSYVSNAMSFTAIAAPSTVPGIPLNLNQYLSNIVTAISVGSSTTSTTEVFMGDLFASSTISERLEIEVTSTADSFGCSGTGSCAYALQSSSTLSTSSLVFGPNNPTTSTDDASTGTFAWTNLGNVYVADNVYASADVPSSGSQTHYIDITGFNFTVPSNATIVGIKAEVAETASGINIRTRSAKIVKAGVISGTEHGVGTPLGGYITYGSSTDLWGLSWTPSDINAPNFGVGVSLYCSSSSGCGIAYVDHARITVYFTMPNTYEVHSVTVSVSSTSSGDLGTGYHWQYRAWNASTSEASAWSSFGGNAESSADFTVDTNPPTITNVATSSVSTSTATITWNTSAEAATSRVQYGTSTAIQFLQAASSTCTTSVLTCSATFVSNTQANSLIVVGIRSGNTSDLVTSVTDTQGNTFVRCPGCYTLDNITSNTGYVYYAQGTAGGADTVTMHQSGNTADVEIQEYSGVAISGSLDAVATSTGNGTSVSSGNVTTQQSNELLYGFNEHGSGATSSAGVGFTLRSDVDSHSASEDEIVPTAGTYAATFTINPTETWGAIIAAFKAVPRSFTSNCSTYNDCTVLADPAPPGTNSHTVNLSGLVTSTTYYFRARSQDALGNEGSSSVNAFNTTSNSNSLPATGQVISAVFDTGASNGATYNSILWKGTAGTGKVQFQLATSNSSSGPWNFYGSSDNGVTCDSSHWYSTTGSDAPVQISCAPQYHTNQRFFRYEVQICSNGDCSTSGATSPVVTNVVVNWSP